jgi:hypothetical protein
MQHSNPIVAANVDESLVELPITVLWKQHLVDYMDALPKQPSTKPGSLLLHYQPTEVLPMTRMSSVPPPDEPDYMVPDNLTHKQPLMRTLVAPFFSSQARGHKGAAYSLPISGPEDQHQQPPLSPPSFSGMLNSEPELTMTSVAKKKTIIAHLFCKERKNGRRWPDPEGEDQTCV